MQTKVPLRQCAYTYMYIYRVHTWQILCDWLASPSRPPILSLSAPIALSPLSLYSHTPAECHTQQARIQVHAHTNKLTCTTTHVYTCTYNARTCTCTCTCRCNAAQYTTSFFVMKILMSVSQSLDDNLHTLYRSYPDSRQRWHLQLNSSFGTAKEPALANAGEGQCINSIKDCVINRT